MAFQTTRIEDLKDVVIINTNQNPKKIGRIRYPNPQQKDNYYAVIQESKTDLPKISLFKGTTKDSSSNGLYIFPIKASSPASATSQAIKEARKRYVRYHQLSPNLSNLQIYVDYN